jgi:hypothetical protein
VKNPWRLISMRTIKDPTYNIYSRGGSVETRKNRLTKDDLKKLASESPREEFELDLGSILEELKDWKKKNPGKDEMDFYEEKGITIKRIQLDKGGVVVSLSDYLKQKQKPKIKKIDLAQGDFNKTVAGLSDSDKDLIKELLRKSGVLVGD